LRAAIDLGLVLEVGSYVNGAAWETGHYHPTPTILDAARALYRDHSVDAITRNDAGAENLRITSVAVEQIVEGARRNRQKVIVMVTGVPGAGKTLVGLNIATKNRDEENPTHAVFLSGNQPLVSVLQEALTRDELARLKAAGITARKGAVAQKIKPFIQIVHHFRDDGLNRPTEPPLDHVVIFDEAQRAWNDRKTSDFLKRRKNRTIVGQSEPELLIGYMDRRQDWAAIICLVGGGQEINDGEAGISAWLDAIRTRFPHWTLFVSPDLLGTEYRASQALTAFPPNARIENDRALHLASSLRSFRCGKVSDFVKALLDCDQSAESLLAEVLLTYPVAITRSLATAKDWIRSKARGTQRFGMVASSEAYRLKPHAIDIRVPINPVHWFLNDRTDPRSSFYLEDAATEFQVQGLELDWICVTWDADLRMVRGGWHFHSFRGHKWTTIRNSPGQQYLLNAYRVLLTRARQGMVIFVPPGDPNDPTRLPATYDSTFDYLRGLGIPVAAGS
jgi:hypothetical protein